MLDWRVRQPITHSL